MPDLVIGVMLWRAHLSQHGGKPRLAFLQRARAQIFAVEVQKIEQEEHEGRGVAAVRRGLDHAERCDAVGADAAQLAVEVGLPGAKRRHGRGDRRVFVRQSSLVRVSNRTAPRSRRACMR